MNGDLLFPQDAIRRLGHAASRAGVLFAGGRHGDKTQLGERLSGRPQPGRADSVIIGE